MKHKEGYMSIRYLRQAKEEGKAEQWSVEILKIQPFQAIDIRTFRWSSRGVVVDDGSASLDLTNGYTLNMNGMLVPDLIKYIEKLGEIYGSYGDMVSTLGEEAIQYDESLLRISPNGRIKTKL